MVEQTYRGQAGASGDIARPRTVAYGPILRVQSQAASLSVTVTLKQELAANERLEVELPRGSDPGFEFTWRTACTSLLSSAAELFSRKSPVALLGPEPDSTEFEVYAPAGGLVTCYIRVVRAAYVGRVLGLPATSAGEETGGGADGSGILGPAADDGIADPGAAGPVVESVMGGDEPADGADGPAASAAWDDDDPGNAGEGADSAPKFVPTEAKLRRHLVRFARPNRPSARMSKPAGWHLRLPLEKLSLTGSQALLASHLDRAPPRPRIHSPQIVFDFDVGASEKFTPEAGLRAARSAVSSLVVGATKRAPGLVKSLLIGRPEDEDATTKARSPLSSHTPHCSAFHLAVGSTGRVPALPLSRHGHLHPARPVR